MFLLFFKKVILRERGRKKARVEEGLRQRETENPKRLHAVSTEPDVGLDLTNHEIVT